MLKKCFEKIFNVCEWPPACMYAQHVPAPRSEESWLLQSGVYRWLGAAGILGTSARAPAALTTKPSLQPFKGVLMCTTMIASHVCHFMISNGPMLPRAGEYFRKCLMEAWGSPNMALSTCWVLKPGTPTSQSSWSAPYLGSSPTPGTDWKYLGGLQ